MVTKEQLTRLDPAEADARYAYLTNKHRGGHNNSKGNSFENHFAVFKLANQFNSGSAPEKISFSSQVPCFIDDLLIENADTNSVEHYQIKDVQALSWTAGDHPLETDFELQNAICTDNGTNAHLELVVSTDEVKQAMEKTMNGSLKGYVSVRHFQKADSISNLLRVNNETKVALQTMCALNNPSTDKLDALGTILLGTWTGSSQKAITLGQILDACYLQNPNYIKGFDSRLSNELAQILAHVPGFTYSIEGGYIKWTYGRSDTGTVSYRIGSVEFLNWESEIIRQTPADFDQLETLLL